MKLSIKVKPGSKQESIKVSGEREFIVSLKAKPEKGEANEDLVRVLAEHFAVSQSAVQIIRGFRGRQKLVEISGL